ncbi:MAG: 2Fe-2S iron-sulfur cluster-binding protein [Mycobacterium sp.]
MVLSCRLGFCGTCEFKVTSGSVDHRETPLTPAERESGAMLTCVSRCGCLRRQRAARHRPLAPVMPRATSRLCGNQTAVTGLGVLAEPGASLAVQPKSFASVTFASP